jgi:lipid-A-disaccharide synthase
VSSTATQVFGIRAGEASGDNLGASLIRGLKQRNPNAQFVGIGGPAMIKEGLDSWIDMERLSVNGLVDPVKRLPDLVRILFQTRDRLLEAGPVCFIGIDSNFFNLLLEGMLKKRGVKTVHYVSPTVWAWRKGRIKSIGRKVDLMLTLYPFELEIYRENNIPAVFVGHPRADEIDYDEGNLGKLPARRKYGIGDDAIVVAILPGSRAGEVARTGPDFLGAAAKIMASKPGVRFIIPAASEKRKTQIEKLLSEQESQLPVIVTTGDSKTVMQAADVVLVNSGTATLEAMLLKKPMVMSYRLGAVSYAIISRLVTTDFFALPNILSQQGLVPELIQDAATPEALCRAVLALLDTTDKGLIDKFDEIHRDLRKNSGEVAAMAILDLVENVQT